LLCLFIYHFKFKELSNLCVVKYKGKEEEKINTKLKR